MHAPVALLQVPSAWHVTLGVVGKPVKPVLQVAVQLEPAVVVFAQLKAPPSGFSGGVLHTACRSQTSILVNSFRGGSILCL